MTAPFAAVARLVRVTHAVAVALRDFGVEPRDLPLSPPRLWQLIQDARK